MEVDAYRFSKIVDYAGTVVNENVVTDTLAAAQNGNTLPLHALNKAFKHLYDLEIPEEDQIVFVSSDFDMALQETNELYRRLDQVEYKKDVTFKVKNYNGREIVVVPPTRFKTLIDLKTKGYGWKAGSQNINFIVLRKDAVYVPIKYDKLRIFSPEVVQDFDGYKINVRIYHDLFVPQNKRFAIYASLAPVATAAANDYTYGTIANLTYNKTNHTIHDLAFAPTEIPSSQVKFYAAAKATVNALVLGQDAANTIQDLTALVNGSPLAAEAPNQTTVYKVFAVRNGKVFAISDQEFTWTI